MSTNDHAAIYLRVSLDPSGKLEAVTRQLADCERLLALKGWTRYETYCDNSISAFDSDKVRPAYDAMVADYLAGRFDKIICWDLDRLTRQPRQLEDWIDWAVQRGLNLVTANGEADLSTDGGRMYARIKAAVARGEGERKSARQRYANQFRAEQGMPHTAGPRAFGYAQDGLETVEREANALVWAAAEVLTGKSLQSVAAALTAQGFTGGSTTARRRGWVLTKGASPAYLTGTGITAPGLRYMLTNPRYVALRVYRGKVVGPGVWPMILDEGTHSALVRTLTNPARLTGNAPRLGRRPAYLLSGGAASCGKCGSNLKRGTHHGGDGYQCRQHCAFGRASLMERAVNRAVIALLTESDLMEALTVSDQKGDAEGARVELDAVRARLAFANEDFASGGWDHDLAGFRDMKSALLTKVADLEAKVTATPRLRVLEGLNIGAEAVREQWTNLDKDRQRAIIRLLLDVQLLPAGKARRWDVNKHLRIMPRVELSKVSQVEFQKMVRVGA